MGAAQLQTPDTSRRALGGVCAAFCIAAQACAAAVAADDARAWLARTDEALTRRNYAGVFVHEHTGESETLRVIHRVDGEGVAERLQSMDGSGREFIRRGNQLICYLPDQRTVLVEHSPDAAVLLRGLPRVEAGSASQYDFREVARARVSGRNARVIAIAPLDQMRYGYRVWIDESTAMPLKTQLRDSRGDVLEQIVFTSLNMMSHISRADLEPAVDARGYRWIRRDADPVDARAPSVSWESAAMPPGFRMTASARQMLPVGPVEHLVFSDGLASVSVFVEPYRDEAGSDTHAVREDEVAIGASSAYSVTMRGYRVTAVGEVPADTVRVIAQAIRNPSPAMVSAAPGTFSGPAEAGAATVSGAPQTSAPAFVPGTRTGFDAEEPSPTTLPPPTVPSFRSYGTDRPIFGPPAGPATTAGGGHR